MQRITKTVDMYDIATFTANPWVEESVFPRKPVDRTPPPNFADIRERLPAPQWEGHADTIACYWKAWELAFGNLRIPEENIGFVSPYIDTAFNGCIFMWDSVFMLHFGRYGSAAFNFQQTLDNFYARQHKDGFISREISWSDGSERFERNDVSSTGPNLMPWSEWEYYLNTGDKERLAVVFPPLLAYTMWFRKWRSWPDGSYFSSGWGCGMDNQPRLPPGYKVAWEHGFMSWIDTTCQQILANRCLIEMARALGRESDVADLATETEHLKAHVNAKMWNRRTKFYFDRFRDGALSDVKTIGAYWALLADIVLPERLDSFLAHLRNKREFNRPHRVPSLSADHPQYVPDGGYWNGAVWAPTNYMVLRGLTKVGQDGLAHEIARDHVANVVAAFVKQGTLFENYAPEKAEGKCTPNFVGWTGVPPISVLFEYVFGLRPDVGTRTLLWDVRLLEAHGVQRYPFGKRAELDLHCAGRQSPDEEPKIQARSTTDLTLIVKWAKGQKTIPLRAQ